MRREISDLLKPTSPEDTVATDLHEFDDYIYDDNPDPALPVLVFIEACRGGYWISRLRDDGTSVASVHWTRNELMELRCRLDEALGVA
jgi:hypothetical protein